MSEIIDPEKVKELIKNWEDKAAEMQAHIEMVSPLPRPKTEGCLLGVNACINGLKALIPEPKPKKEFIEVRSGAGGTYFEEVTQY